jgi:hypothetical protein
MEGSAISRDSSLKSISNAKDPDMDGVQKARVGINPGIVGNSPVKGGVSQDSWTMKNPSGEVEIKGGQEYC